MKKLLCLLLALLLLGGCAPTEAPGETDDPPPPVDEPRQDDPLLPEAEALLATLCSPAHMGRAPGSPGNQAAAAYIASFFKGLGLEPAFEGYLQPYEEQCIVTERADPKAALIAADGTRTELTAGEDYVFYNTYEAVDVCLPIPWKSPPTRRRPFTMPKAEVMRAAMRT